MPYVGLTKTESEVMAIQTLKKYFEEYNKQKDKRGKLVSNLQVMVRHPIDPKYR